MYRELGDGHWLSDKIDDNEIFPVGGYIAGRITEYMKVDADTFQTFFDRVAKNKEAIESNKAFGDWYKKRKTGLDYSLFCHMYAFNAVMKTVFPNATKNAGKRAGFYEGKRTLSEAVSKNMCACNEYSVLAQLYFQSQNIPTRYVGGELVSNGDFEAFEPHSFIVFQQGEKDYVYDPVNSQEQQLPRIAEFVGKKDNEYLETRNLFNDDKWYYAGGRKGEFLKYYPQKSLTEILASTMKKLPSKKDKQNV